MENCSVTSGAEIASLDACRGALWADPLAMTAAELLAAQHVSERTGVLPGAGPVRGPGQ